jgi:hypothetical protein
VIGGGLAGAQQAAGKGQISGEKLEKHTSGAEAHIDFIGFMPGTNPRPTARIPRPTVRMGFSAACKAHLFFGARSVPIRRRSGQALKPCPDTKHLRVVPGVSSNLKPVFALLQGSIGIEPDQAALAVEVGRAEKILRREINYAVFTPQELKRRLRNGDGFVTDIWNGKRVELIGDGEQAAEDRHQISAAVS